MAISYVIIAPLKDPEGNRAGLIAIPRLDDGTTSLSDAVLLSDTDDAANGAFIAEMLAEPAAV